MYVLSINQAMMMIMIIKLLDIDINEKKKKNISLNKLEIKDNYDDYYRMNHSNKLKNKRIYPIRAG